MPLENTISTQQLSSVIGTADCPTLVDLRIDEDFAADPRLIPTAFRRDFLGVQDWGDQLPDRPVVVVCHKGLKISQGVAALLRSQGRNAVHLIGGSVAWAEQNRMTIPAERLPSTVAEGPSRWVTSFEPGIDAIASAWLIRRFIDTRAQFLLVEADQIGAVAERLGATAFAAQDCEEDFRTFGNLLQTFTLLSPGLDYLERTIAGADGNGGPMTPESAGIVAAITGAAASRATDLERIETAMIVLDAFYAWCRSSRSPA